MVGADPLRARHDDAIALLLAGHNPGLDLLGVSVVSGNQTIEKTTVNALSICQYLGINVPVAMGAEKPLQKPAMICPEIHGASGLDGVTFPPLTKKLDPRQGYELIIDLCLSHQGVILVPTGPLTNIALALKHEPKIKDHIAKIVLMGGSMGFGNVTPAAEFNILVDPEAAEIVFASGLPIYMNGLDVTREVLVHHSIIERMDQVDNKASRFFHAIGSVASPYAITTTYDTIALNFLYGHSNIPAVSLPTTTKRIACSATLSGLEVLVLPQTAELITIDAASLACFPASLTVKVPEGKLSLY